MGIELLTERHADQITGVLSCYDRILIFGTLPGVCFADGMTSYLYQHKIRIFDYPRFAEPFRNQLRENAARIAADNSLEIEHIGKKNFRQDDKIKKVLQKRGAHPGLAWIFSAMEPCATDKPWHNKQSGRRYLKPGQAKCLHDYFYFIDEELGPCYVRAPAWLPCRLQICCNGHNWLAAQWSRRNIHYRLPGNAFVEIEDWERARRIADGWRVKRIHKRLDPFARRFCPIGGFFRQHCHCSINQAEYASDIVFRRQADLGAIHENLTRSAIHAMRPGNIATFLGRKLHGNYQGEMGNRHRADLTANESHST